MTLHKTYEQFLKEDCYNVKESTRTTYRARLRNFPEPSALTPKWFAKRSREVSPHTLQQERLLIKKFKRWHGDDIEDFAKKYKLPQMTTPVTAKDLYTREELQKIFDACIDTRDRAMLKVLYDSAVRHGELCDMQYEDVKVNGIKATIFVDGKTGKRTVYLKDSVPALVAWMNVHPLKSGPLWTTLDFPVRQLGQSASSTRIREIIDRADLDRKTKRVVHMFRHTRITELVRLGITGLTLKKIAGWSKNSNMESVYAHLTDHDVTNELGAKVWGEEKVETPQPMLVSGKCPRCGKMVDESDVICVNCSFPLTSDKIVEVVEGKSNLEERIAKLEKMLADILPQSSPIEVDEEYEEWKREQAKKQREEYRQKQSDYK